MTQLQQTGNAPGSNSAAPDQQSRAGPSLSANLQNGHDHISKVEAADSPSEAGFSVKSETSAVEEAAVAALGQLSKAKPNEGGDEARICKFSKAQTQTKRGSSGLLGCTCIQ